jgi:3-mercaptopyruvate sulfurtransferase SseA
VFYCSCPDELSSVRAALRLRRHGVTRLHALLGKFSAWRELGFPVETPLSGAGTRMIHPPGLSVKRHTAEMPTGSSRRLAFANA